LTVKNSLKKHNLLKYTELMGMIPRKQVIKEYEKASLLLLPINKADNAMGRIPGKLFEILRTGKNILVLGPDDGDVKSIVEMEKRGRSFEYDNKDLPVAASPDISVRRPTGMPPSAFSSLEMIVSNTVEPVDSHSFTSGGLSPLPRM